MSEFLTFLVGMSPVLVIMLCTIVIDYFEVVRRHKRKNILGDNKWLFKINRVIRSVAAE
ncbi:MAG: hypothetical protein IBX64_13400 [Actinobacteria bacterium]|nr:hypothetical protein [Actinomycetota bacterium]